MDFGMMRVNYKRSSVLNDAWWPGVTVNLAGFTFSHYSGEVQLKDSIPDVPRSWKPHGRYWNIGYTKTFTNMFDRDVEENMKRPFLVPYLGGGIGGWKTNDGGAWMNFVLYGGVSVNLFSSLALSAGFQSGFNFTGALGSNVEALVPGVQTAHPRFFGNVNVGLRFHYPLGYSISGVSANKARYHAPGWYHYEYQSGDWIYQGSYYSEGGTWSDYAIVTTPEIVSIAPVVYFTKGHDGYGATKAFGGKATLRAGLLNADVQYMKGQVGFHINSGSFAGGVTNQCYWNMSQTSFSVGLNAFNLFAPLKGPSVYRFIIGYRFGITNMEAIYDGPSVNILPKAPNEEKVKTRNFFMAAEFGRFGLSWDFYNSKAMPDLQSNGVFSAYYMIPLVNIGGRR